MLKTESPEKLTELCRNIERQIRFRTGITVNDLRVEAMGDQVILMGRAKRYYTKQQATHAAYEVIGQSQNLTNDIVVT